MAILPVSLEDVEFFTTLANPSRTYISSSSGVTGSISVFPRGSRIEKEIRPLSNFSVSYLNDDDIENFRNAALSEAKTTSLSGSFSSAMEVYLDEVNNQSISAKKQSKIYIDRFTPGVDLTKNMLKKMNVKDILMNYYRTNYPTANWGYTNYNTLNFFTAPGVTTSSVLLYPNIENTNAPAHNGYVTGAYALSGAFSFDFRINPRYKVDSTDGSHFKAGTIFHLSSSYALSLITGSHKDENGLPASFRLQLQLSHSADIAPSKAIPGTYPNNLIFLSDDNVLDWNNWHRVVVRWGTNAINDGTGSFNIDGVDRGTFVISSGTIMPKVYSSPARNPDVLSIGNFYEGINQNSSSLSYFFTDIVKEREGLEELENTGGNYDHPLTSSFKHPLKAEVHELVIHRTYLTNPQISASMKNGLANVDPEKHALYIPPFFVSSTPIRKYTAAPLMGGTAYGGVLQTPFFAIDGSTDDPFNVAMSFGVNGHYINLENFVKDFVNEVFPRLHHLSATIIDYTSSVQEANKFLYDDPSVKKRNLTILPCDDGNFYPNYGLLSSETTNKFVDYLGRVDFSIINLDNLLSTASLLFGKTYDSSTGSEFIEQQIGFSPEQPGLIPGPAILNIKNNIASTIATDEGAYGPGVQRDVSLAIYQRTKDPSSNQVTLFNISNLYYGSRILPGSFELKDSDLSGSSGKISITLKDDGFGNIYRADALTPHAEQSSVGNIFYNEGVVLIKSPHLYFFGKEQYEMSFKGEHQLHTSKYDILAPSGLLNSSSNPTYARVENAISASANPLDTSKFVYISNINFHDENLNVVAKAVLAQPVIKREEEKILFKVAFDF